MTPRHPTLPRRTLLATCTLLLGATLAGHATAQADAASYPNKPIRLIVPFPAGGAADALARAMGQALQDKLGASVVVDNRAGAGGTIGTTAVAKAPADGYTLLLGNVSTLAIAPSLYPALQYDPAKDFKPVSLVAKTPLVYVVSPKLPVKTLPELIALARKEPGKISFGSSGAGSITHLTGELLNLAAGSTMVHVPYKGSAPVVLALMSGELQLGVTQVVEMLPQYKASNIGALAVTGSEKSPPLPQVETTASQGFKNLNATTWYGIVAPAGVPDAIVHKLNSAIVAALADDGLKKRYADEGLILQASSSAAFKQQVQDEIGLWAKVVKDAGVKLD
jgi:tripartite-type tricarboxylate transporter receptor subunit TctC